MKARALRAVVAVVALTGLSFTAACGGGDGGGERAEPERATGQPAAAGQGVLLTQAELEKVAVTKTDLPGYTVEWISALVSAPSLPVEPHECQAIGDTLGFVSQYRPTARLIRVMSKAGDGGSLGLAAYDAGDAENVMADVRAGVRTCAGKAFDPNDGFQYEAVTALPGPGKGDESVSFTLVQVVGDSKQGFEQRSEAVHTYVLVRTGTVVATFRALNPRGKEVAVVPADIIDAQVRKLAKAG